MQLGSEYPQIQFYCCLDLAGFVGILVAHIWFLIKRRANPIFSGLAWALRKRHNKEHCLVLNRPLWLLKELFCFVEEIRKLIANISLLSAQVTFFFLPQNSTLSNFPFFVPLCGRALKEYTMDLKPGCEAILYLKAWTISWTLLNSVLRETLRKVKAIRDTISALHLSSFYFCLLKL